MIKKLAGKTLSRHLSGLQLGDIRRLFNARAKSHGVKVTKDEVDLAIYGALETGFESLPEYFKTTKGLR